MEQKGLEILQMLEGKDETSAARSVCNLSIQQLNGKDLETVMEKSTLEAVVSVYVTAVWMAVDLEFENRLDLDYLQMAQVCQEYAEMTRVEKRDEVKSVELILAVTPVGDYDYFLIGSNGFWSFMPDRADGYCHAIRFIFPREQCGIYELMENSVEQMIAEVVSGMD